jgi:hypothetical protein
LQAVSRALREIKAIRETPERLDLLDRQAPRELRERIFQFTSIQRMAPARMLTRLL